MFATRRPMSVAAQLVKSNALLVRHAQPPRRLNGLLPLAPRAPFVPHQPVIQTLTDQRAGPADRKDTSEGAKGLARAQGHSEELGPGLAPASHSPR